MIIREVDLSEVDTVIEVLSEAFDDDPVNEWAFPGEGRRTVANPIIFRTVVGEVLATGGRIDVADDLSGAILWSHSDSEEELDPEKAFPGLADAELERLVALFELLAGRSPASEYYHAQFIGVVKNRQRQGIGARLLQHGLDRYSVEGAPAYLEASSAESAKLYRRLGFRDHGDPVVIDGGPLMWPMWREPG